MATLTAEILIEGLNTNKTTKFNNMTNPDCFQTIVPTAKACAYLQGHFPGESPPWITRLQGLYERVALSFRSSQIHSNLKAQLENGMVVRGTVPKSPQRGFEWAVSGSLRLQGNPLFEQYAVGVIPTGFRIGAGCSNTYASVVFLKPFLGA